ncbi:MAG: FAD-dependent oxidoreductase [Alphaproteobacteria bacterium]|nr:FAD-dependent oxidoreductase [Alphaproteobacteria bacterium]
MTRITRRSFTVMAGAAAGASLAMPSIAFGASARIAVVGGGFGGATAARYLKRLDPKLNVTLIEPSTKFITCPFSNLVLGGLKTMDGITHGYDGLAKAGVRIIRASAQGIDPSAKRLSLSTGTAVPYDKLVLSPGVDLNFGALPGYDRAAAEKMPHAWKAGAQTLLLKRQLEAMADGGTVILVCPDNPYRCPPGPYERASMIAHYLKTRKPKSKILILDAKESFSKQGLFQEGWQAVYGDMIEWLPGKAGGKVTAVDAKAMTVKTEFGDQKGAVINVIPPQTAGEVARAAGLAEASGWCAVDVNTFQSKADPDTYVVGDAAIAGQMPKSGFSANSQAKVVALAIVEGMNGRKPAPPAFANTCYSLVAPKYGISVANVYRVTEQGLVSVEGGVSPTGQPAQFRSQEATYAQGWYDSITMDMFG